MAPRELLDELCGIVSTFICQPGVQLDLEKNISAQQIFTKGGSQSVCTVKLVHGQTYNVEFVYKFWAFKLQAQQFPFCPLFVITNNGLALTLKCYLSEPRDSPVANGQSLKMNSDVDLGRNSSVVIGQDDFVKFKSTMVYNRDLDIFNSMVVFRTYITDRRQSLQFLIVKPKNSQRVENILNSIANCAANSPEYADYAVRRAQKKRRGGPKTQSAWSDDEDEQLDNYAKNGAQRGGGRYCRRAGGRDSESFAAGSPPPIAGQPGSSPGERGSSSSSWRGLLFCGLTLFQKIAGILSLACMLMTVCGVYLMTYLK